MNNPPRELQAYNFRAVAEILIQFGEEQYTSEEELERLVLEASDQLVEGEAPSHELRENEHAGHVTFKGFVVTNQPRNIAFEMAWRKISTVLDDIQIKLIKHLGGRLLGSNLSITGFRISKAGFKSVPRKVGVYFFNVDWKEKRQLKHGRLPQKYVGPHLTMGKGRGRDRTKQYWHGRRKS